MELTRTDLQHTDEVIKAVSKLRFDLNGIEVMKLSTTLKWLADLRVKIAGEVEQQELAHQERVDEAMRLMASHQAANDKPKELVYTPVDPLPTKDIEDLAAKAVEHKSKKGRR